MGAYNEAMRTVRRHDYTPRVEMMPMIDVVFLLLTFFIFAVAVMNMLKTSGVDLMSVEGAEQAVDEPVVLLEVDGGGGYWIDGEPVADAELDARLRELAARPDAPPLVVTLQDVEASIDRGPVMWRLLGRIRQAGVTDLRLPKLDSGSGVSE